MINRLKALYQCLFLICVVISNNARAENPVVCLDTSLGEFCIELFEQEAPVTVENFLGYVLRGDYDNTIIHRVVPSFVMQAGGYSIVKEDGSDNVSLTQVERQPSIINEFGISNTRGTVAMAKLGGEPDSATSEWFVNLTDNSQNLDSQNEGFTVFGAVVGDGMQVVDAISQLQLVNFDGVLSSTPTINFDLNAEVVKVENFVFIQKARKIEAEIAPVGVFTNNRLKVPVDAGSFGKLNVEMELLTVQPEITFRLDLASLTPLADQNIEMAVYNEQTLILKIASIDVEGNFTVSNVVMQMTDPEQLVFTVLSLEGL